MPRILLAVCLCATIQFGVCFAAEPAGPNRVALVIGNDSYRHLSPLETARADAFAIAKALERAGFQVSLRLDVGEKAMRAAVREFKSRLVGGDEGVFFYSGHAIQLGSANYLLPADIVGESEEQIRDDALPLQRILDDMQEQKAKFSLVILDACRSNPFRAKGRMLGGRGLAPTTAANGQLILYSAGSGQEALDRLGEKDRDPNGVFTRVFLREMEKPGVPVDRVLRNVRDEVIRLAASVGHAQVPALYDQAATEFYFKPVTAAGAEHVVRAQREAVEKAVTEAMRRATEQAAAEREALRESFERQAAAERERAAAERIALQQTMAKMLKEALERQAAAMEAERTGSSAGAPVQLPPPQRPLTPLAASAAPAAGSAATPAAASAAAPLPAAPATALPQVFEEFEYKADDRRWNKLRKLVHRVKATAADGSLEEITVDGYPTGDWAFDGKPLLIGLPVDAGFVVTPYWRGLAGLPPGQSLPQLPTLQVRPCIIGSCTISGRIVGAEKLSVAAGVFDTVRIDVVVEVHRATMRIHERRLTAWYAVDTGRLVKQHVTAVTGYHNMSAIDEIIELVAFRQRAQ